MKKTNRFKRIISLVLTLGLLFSMVPDWQVFAADDPVINQMDITRLEDGRYKFSFSGNNLELTKIKTLIFKKSSTTEGSDLIEEYKNGKMILVKTGLGVLTLEEKTKDTIPMGFSANHQLSLNGVKISEFYLPTIPQLGNSVSGTELTVGGNYKFTGKNLNLSLRPEDMDNIYQPPEPGIIPDTKGALLIPFSGAKTYKPYKYSATDTGTGIFFPSIPDGSEMTINGIDGGRNKLNGLRWWCEVRSSVGTVPKINIFSEKGSVYIPYSPLLIGEINSYPEDGGLDYGKVINITSTEPDKLNQAKYVKLIGVEETNVNNNKGQEIPTNLRWNDVSKKWTWGNLDEDIYTDGNPAQKYLKVRVPSVYDIICFKQGRAPFTEQEKLSIKPEQKKIYAGEYKVLLMDDDADDSNTVFSKNKFVFNTIDLKSLQLNGVIDDSAVIGQVPPKEVNVHGRSILTIYDKRIKLNNVDLPINKIIQVESIENGEKYRIHYDVTGVTFDGNPIKELVREISVKFDKSPANHNQTDKSKFLAGGAGANDAIPISMQSGGSSGIKEKKVDIDVETVTKVVKADDSSPIPLTEIGTLVDGFTFKGSYVDPKVTTLTGENYAYYRYDPNTILGQKISLLLNIQGEDFKARQTTTGSSINLEDMSDIISQTSRDNMELPTVELYYDGTSGSKINSAKVNVIRVRDSSGKDMDGLTGREYGTSMLIAITPIDGQELMEELKSHSTGDPSKIDLYVRVLNPGGGDSGIVKSGYEIRFPEGGPKTAEDWPKIKTLKDENGKDTIVFSNTSTTKVKLSFSGIAGEASSYKIYIDGEKLPESQIKEQTTAQGTDRIFEVTVPARTSRTTRLQLVAPNGLMDSKIVRFGSIKNPTIESIIPEFGGDETTLIIKRKTTDDVYFLPPDANSTISKNKVGTRVLFDGEDIELPYYKDPKNPDFTVKELPKAEDIAIVEEKNPYEKELRKYVGDHVRWLDRNTIKVSIPKDYITKSGKTEVKVSVINPDDGTSNDILIKLVPSGNMEIESITPDKSSYQGGIRVRIKFKVGKELQGIDTQKIKVYFGDKIATGVKIEDGDGVKLKEISVSLPSIEEAIFIAGGVNEIKVPVTIYNGNQNSIAVKKDGYTYVRRDKVEVKKVVNTLDQTEKGSATGGYKVRIDGGVFKFVADPTLYDKDNPPPDDSKYLPPRVFMGDNLIEDVTAPASVISEAKFDVQTGHWYKTANYINAQVKPAKAGETAIKVIVLNRDGSQGSKDNAFTYIGSKPEILSSSILKAKMFNGETYIFTKDIYEEGLAIAFGEVIGEVEFAEGQKLEFGDADKAIEKFVIQYENGKAQFLYKNPSTGTLEPMNDIYIYDPKTTIADQAVGSNALPIKPGETKYVGIKWKNAAYHKGGVIPNESIPTLNDEIVQVRVIEKDTALRLQARRHLAKVEEFKSGTGFSTIKIKTPYKDKPEKTKIFVINGGEGQGQAEAGFEFTIQGEEPVIDSVEGSFDVSETEPGSTTPNIISVKESDIKLTEDRLIIVGKNLNNIEYVQIGNLTISGTDNIKEDGGKYEKLEVKIPKATDDLAGKLLPIRVKRKEANIVSTDDSKRAKRIYFRYITTGEGPTITGVTPSEGIESGGNIISITGNNFNTKSIYNVEKGIEVKLNGLVIPKENVTYVKAGDQIKELIVKNLPATTPGEGVITVTNGNGGAATVPFKIISQPIIESMTGPGGGKIFYNDTSGEITLIGQKFVSGAKVYIGSTVVNKKAYTTGEIKISGIKGLDNGQNNQVNVVGGYEAVSVKVENEKTIKFKLPSGIEGIEGNVTVVVVNPDTGVGSADSSVIEPPVPTAPTIKAVAGYNRTITLYWTMPDKSVLNKPKKFEIYGRERGNDYTYIGDVSYDETQSATTSGSMMKFLVKDLKSDTRYYFKVRVLNEYGESKDLGEADATTLTDRQDYKETEKLDKKDEDLTKIKRETKFEVSGDKLVVTTGTRDTEINMNKVEYAKYTTRYIQVPISQIKEGGTIRVVDKGISLGINLSNLDVKELQGLGRRDDAVFRIKLQIPDKRIEEGVTSKLPKGTKKASRVYSLGFEIQNGTEVIKVQSLRGTIDMTLQYEPTSYGTFSKINLAKYDEAKDRMNAIANGMMVPILEGGYYVLLGQK